MKKYTKKQKEWCKNYQDVTLFAPMMGAYESGNENFQEAAHKSVVWFEMWASDALIKCDKDMLSINTGE
jgi:tRNA A37 N6-isopentenylltransferase MiaA